MNKNKSNGEKQIYKKTFKIYLKVSFFVCAWWFKYNSSHAFILRWLPHKKKTNKRRVETKSHIRNFCIFLREFKKCTSGFYHVKFEAVSSLFINSSANAKKHKCHIKMKQNIWLFKNFLAELSQRDRMLKWNVSCPFYSGKINRCKVLEHSSERASGEEK